MAEADRRLNQGPGPFSWSAETNRLLFENSPDAILLIENGFVIDCNQAAVEVFRASHISQLVSTPLDQLTTQNGIHTEKGHRFESKAKRLDGSELSVEVSLSVIPSDGRQIIHAVYRDISRRKAAEKELSESREAIQTQTEVLASILHNIGDAVIVADTQYRFLTFNPAAERMFGTVAIETRAEGWSRAYGLYLPDQVTEFPADELPIARSIRGEEVDDLEMFVRHDKAPDGVWIRVSGRPLRNSAGELTGGVIVCRDITERKREDAFRAGQSRVLEMIASGESIENVLEALVRLIEAQSDDMVCSVLLLSEDGKSIVSGAAPNLPEFYRQAVNGAPIGPKNGSCGTAMYLGKPVIVSDMLNDPLWEDYLALAKISGFRACWSTPIFDGSGKVLGSFAMYYPQPKTPTGSESRLTEVATHIAGIAIEHQRAEHDLRASEERFAKAFNANPNPMSLSALDDGRIIEVNDSFVQLMGYLRPEIVGQKAMGFLYELSPDDAKQLLGIKEGSVVRDIEAKVKTQSGQTRIVLLSSLVVEISGQQCILTVANDITERRRAEEQVKLLQEISMEVAVAVDLHSALEVVLRKVCQTTGWVLGQSWIPRVDGSAIECGAAWFSAIDGLDNFRLGSEKSPMPPGVGLPGRVWTSKQPTWVRDVTLDHNFPRALLAREAGLRAALALPIIADDRVISVIEFFMREPQPEDERLVKVITAVAAQLDLVIERKLAEDQLRTTEAELAHVARVTTMGELAASIAHEVNQPLGAIVGNADICLMWLDDGAPDLAQLREAIQDIAHDGHRASQVIARIRSLVKKQIAEKAPINLNDVARDVLDLVAHEAQRKQVTLVAELGKDLPAVSADRIQLQQVLINLVMNGIDAMNGVDGRKPCLTLRTDRLGDDVVATVSDCGVGFPPEKAEQLFKPFHTTKPTGMGMGLAISRSIIEAHGGRLWAENNVDYGASFRFSLPATNTRR